MNKKIVIGLTGGIASGKSRALSEFKRLGAKTLDCDKIAREAVRPGNPAYNKIVKLFSKSVLKPNGALDRKKIATIVFNDSLQRKKLEEIVHPSVIRQLKIKIDAVKSGLIVADIPLLFEAGLEKIVDETVLVWVPRKKQLYRFMKREKLSRDEALLRIRSQMPLSKKKKLAGHVIDNSGGWEKTKRRVKELYKKFSRTT